MNNNQENMLRDEEEEQDDSDRDKDYIQDTAEDQAENSSSSEYEKPTRTRKRKIKKVEWKRTKAKIRRNRGQEYVGHRGRHHEAKHVKPYPHTCRYMCREFSENDRLKMFEDYWNLADWNLQTAFLHSCVRTEPPRRRARQAQNPKSISTKLHLSGKRVCKQFILHTLDISNKRLSNVIKNISKTGIAHTDKRGRHQPSNKMNSSVTNFVKKHISSFPKFRSHYTRHYNPNRKYLDSSLNVNKMYDLYKELCAEKNKQPVKVGYYRMIFNTCFNLTFHKPYTDTCSLCDRLDNKIKTETPEEVTRAKIEKEIHLRKAEKARTEKTNAKTEAAESPNKIAICFDLQKTLPTPLLTNSKVYYLRQLWTYNFGIHNLASGEAQMFMWHEGEASRGSQEIMSCLLKFITTLLPGVTHIEAFSDNAGGQNKNKHIIKFWSYVVLNTQIETVDHKFLISGHSFMECDQDFGVIEKMKKKTSYVFNPNEWMDLVSKSSKKFMVIRMEQTDFKSIAPMNEIMKDNVKGLRKIQWLHFEKQSPMKLFYKDTLEKDFPFTEIDLKKTGRSGRPLRNYDTLTLPPLYREPLKIKLPKYKNLLELLPFIPPIYHEFYRGLRHEETQNRRVRNSKDPPGGNEIEESLQEGEDHNDDLVDAEEDNELFLLSDYDE